MIAHKPYRIAVEKYDQMIAAGIFTENDAIELIRGEIVPKMPIGSQHAACVTRLVRQLIRSLGESAIVSPQNPIRLSDSEPEPDVAVLRPRADDYAEGKPTADDVLLVIEVADSSLEFDRENKLSVYAEAGIAEYWIVNLLESIVEVYREPEGSNYASRHDARSGETLEIRHLAGASIAASEILPP
jgi:Uma2 family endonuclease